MWWGSPSSSSNNVNGTKFNLGDETEQLPLMKIHTDAQKSGGSQVWLRDIENDEYFATAYSDGSPAADYASDSYSSPQVRAYFLID